MDNVTFFLGWPGLAGNILTHVITRDSMPKIRFLLHPKRHDASEQANQILRSGTGKVWWFRNAGSPSELCARRKPRDF